MVGALGGLTEGGRNMGWSVATCLTFGGDGGNLFLGQARTGHQPDTQLRWAEGRFVGQARAGHQP